MCYWPLDIFYEVPIHDFCRFLNLLHFCFLMTYRSCLHTMDTLLKITLKISPPPMSGVCFHPLKGEVPNCNEGEFINLFSMVDHFCVHLSNLCLRLGCIPHWDFFFPTGLAMATWDRSSRRPPQVAEPAVEGEPHLPMGRELSEANRFAYAALCGISLSQLFPEPEHR